MTHFEPGKIIKTFTTKSGHEAVIRYPKWEDLDEMVRFINTVSYEDIYVTFSGESINKEGEMYYLSDMIRGMEMQNSVYLTCFVGGRMVGSCTVLRDLVSRKRSYHVATYGITIANGYRGEGIGLELSQATLSEAIKMIPGIRMFTLNVYGPNTPAQALYKKLGFTECGRIPKAIWYKGSYIDEIKMYKQIA